MRSITEDIIRGKDVILRADLDIPLHDGVPANITRLSSISETLSCLKQAKRVVIIGHLGRPNGVVEESLRMRPLVSPMSSLIGEPVNYIPTWDHDEITISLRKERKWHLLENVRFHPGEEKNDDTFSRQLASYGSLFVFDAFAVSHRVSASTVGIASHIPAYAGMRVTEEVTQLSQVVEHPKHPFLVIIGGAKIETKLPVITHMSKIADAICVGGKLIHEIAEKHLSFSEKVFIAGSDDTHLDIDTKSAEVIRDRIRSAACIVWNGPVGKFEDPTASIGTNIIVSALCASPARTIIGGGETIQAVESFGSLDKIGFVSVGGGAMLEFLSGKKLPALQTLF